MMETNLINNGTVISITGALLVSLIAVIGYFFKRELAQFDNIKGALSDIDKKTTAFVAMARDIESINEKFETINEKFDLINEKFDSVNNKLQTIDKDGSTTKHELEMISNMIKPLFEMKETVDRTNKDIGVLYERTNEYKSEIFKLSERVHEMEKQVLLLLKK